MKGFRSEEKQTESDHQDDEHDGGARWAELVRVGEGAVET